MGADHHHDSGGLPDAANRRQWRRLAVALASSVVVLVAVAVGGCLGLAGTARRRRAPVRRRLRARARADRDHAGRAPPSQQRTFGWERAEVLAAGADAVLLLGVTAWVAVEAVSRLRHPQPVDAPLMLAAAAFGLVAGAVSLGFLHGGHRENFAVRGAYLEVLGDLLGSLAAVVAAVVIWAGGPLRIDAVASLLIAGMMAPRPWRCLASAVHVLLEGRRAGWTSGTSGSTSSASPACWTCTTCTPDDHQWAAGADRPRRRRRGGDRRGLRRERPGPARRLPRPPLRRRALDVPAGALGSSATTSRACTDLRASRRPGRGSPRRRGRRRTLDRRDHPVGHRVGELRGERGAEVDGVLEPQPGRRVGEHGGQPVLTELLTSAARLGHPVGEGEQGVAGGQVDRHVLDVDVVDQAEGRARVADGRDRAVAAAQQAAAGGRRAPA